MACTHHLALGGLFTPPSFVCLCTNATLRIDANSGSKHRVRDEQRVYVVTEDTYVALDLSSIPSNATITSATLSLWTSNDLSDNDRTIRVYRLKTAFDESSATWNESASGVSWQSAGASGTNDRESTDIGSVLVLANEADGTEKQISLNTTKLQEMVSGTFTNNGFIIIADTELNDRFNYKSSDASTASQRPKLVIQYTTSTPTPGPSPTPTNTPAGPTATPTRTPTPSQTPTVAPTTPPPSFQNATFVYDGDGKRVKSTFNGTTTTYFVGAHFELTGSTVTKYYYAGSQRIAMRSGTWDFNNPVTGTLNFLLGDHLGSTSLTTDAAGDIVSEIRYKAWGTVRYATEGVSTKYQYTGQYSYEAEFGLYFYNARWYDPVLSRFAQADSVLDNPITGWDRYSYVNNNPIRYTDPSGHKCAPENECDKKINYFAQSENGRPDILNRKSLSKGGNKLYDLYLRMYGDKSGWWWDEYGSNGFSIWEFMAIQWGLERDWYPNLEDYATALSNGSAVWCQSKPTCSMTTAEWNLNFLAAYSKRPQAGVSKCVTNPSCDIGSVVRKPPQEGSMQVVAAIHQRLPLSVNPVGPQDLYSVGNVSLSADILIKMIKRGMVYHAWGSGNTMVMLRKCESDLYGYASANDGTRNINMVNYSNFCG